MVTFWKGVNDIEHKGEQIDPRNSCGEIRLDAG